MRTPRSNPVVWQNDIPIGSVQLAERRTAPMIEFYGCHIREVTIQTLAASCYLQGIEDAWRALGTPATAAPPILDYTI